MAVSDDDFLTRWSRRKVQSRQGLRKKEEAPEAGPAAPAERLGEETEVAARTAAVADDAATGAQAMRHEQDPAIAPDEQKPDQAAALEEAVDPSEFDDFDFDKLDFDSDYTRFMKTGVPEAVRRRALRMLWQSNPILANVDGLNDYDEDFTDAALAVKNLVTSWKVGSGYLTEEERLASYGDADDGATRKEQASAEDSAQTADPEKDDTPDGAPEAGVAEADMDAAGADAEPDTDMEPQATAKSPAGPGQPDDGKA